MGGPFRAREFLRTGPAPVKTLRRRVDTLSRLLEEFPLRIALVVERFAPGTGGVENVAWQVAHELVRQGEQVHVLTREDSARAATAATPDGDGAFAAPRATGAPIVLPIAPRPGSNPLRALAFSRAAAAATARGRFDVVHSFGRTRHQHLYRAGGGSHEDYLRRNHTRWGRAYRACLPRHASLLWLDRAVYRDGRQRIQCASRLVADRLVDRHGVAPERILLLPNAVDGERFDPRRNAEAGRALRQRLAPGGERVWLFAASGWRRKGLESCLVALSRLTADGDRETRLWVAGRDDPGPWRRRVERAGLRDRVEFLGPRLDLERVYAAADGLVLPTRYDPFANVTFEAAAAGRAIVTTTANGAAEWLSEEACRRVRPEDAEALTAVLRDCADPSVLRRMGDAARREVLAYGWPEHVARLRSEYAAIARAPR